MKFPVLQLKEAQRLRICRVCRGLGIPRIISGVSDPFVKFGQEHAHQSCLDWLSRQPSESSEG